MLSFGQAEPRSVLLQQHYMDEQAEFKGQDCRLGKTPNHNPHTWSNMA